MRKYFLLLLSIPFLSTAVNAQAPTISSTRFGNIKLGFPIDSINKYVDQKISIARPTKEDEYLWDTVAVVYKGIPVKLVINQYLHYEKKVPVSELRAIYTESPNVSTKSGIKAGQDKFEIIKKLDGSYLYVRPEKDLGKNISVIVLWDQDNYTQLTFYFRDNILYAFECTMTGEED